MAYFLAITAHPAIDVLQCKIDLESSQVPYGAVKEGNLRVKGQVAKGNWESGRDQILLVDPDNDTRILGRATFFADAVDPDLDSDDSSQSMWCLKFAAAMRDPDQHIGLVLLQANEKIHERI